MSKETDYRQSAAETIQLANHAATIADRMRLLALAGLWLDLAERAHRIAALRA